MIFQSIVSAENPRTISSTLAAAILPRAGLKQDYQSAPVNRFLATSRSAMRRFIDLFLAALHETRRKQGARELMKHRHLIDGHTSDNHSEQVGRAEGF